MKNANAERGGLEVLEPRQGSAAFVASAYNPPSWATGFISRNDARFLYECLECFAPRTLIEIGVASGVSTVLLLEAIKTLGLDARLYSFDITDCFYAKPELRLGQYIFEHYETPPAYLSLNPLVDSMRLTARLEEICQERADFTFIDANHYHPWPCLDLLAIIHGIKPGGWVALHDINLPILAPEFQCYGPLRLFNSWPGERRVFADSGEQPNIGAIRLFDTLAENVDAILGVLAEPWDIHVDYREFAPVYEILKEAGGGRARRLRWIHFRNMPPQERRKYLTENAKDWLRPLLGRPVRSPA